jgi:hypothetical protein
LDWLRHVGFDFSVLSEFRDCLTEDKLLQKPMSQPGLKKFTESPEDQQLDAVK